MHHFVTGVAGFIGSHLADCLLADCTANDGCRISGVDDLSLGKLEHLKTAQRNSGFRFAQADISDARHATECLREASAWGGRPDIIWHLAANSDIAAGVADASIDFERTLLTTFAVLEAAEAVGVKHVAFASTSAVYGERDDLLTEDSGPLLPISNYGAAKLGSEALLSAAAESFLDRVWIFSFPNIVGSRMTHGALHDFLERLESRPPSLTVLGDGSQTKPYLHVAELIAAMQFIVAHSNDRRNVFNIGPTGDGTRVSFIAERMIARCAPGTSIAYTGGDRGWVGDVPHFRYSTEKLARLGWRPKFSSEEAVLRAIEELADSRGFAR
jgi:UDP-glucose 4-epimerase